MRGLVSQLRSAPSTHAPKREPGCRRAIGFEVTPRATKQWRPLACGRQGEELGARGRARGSAQIPSALRGGATRLGPRPVRTGPAPGGRRAGRQVHPVRSPAASRAALRRRPSVTTGALIAALLAALASALGAQEARAQPPRGGVAFSWVRGEGADGCPGRPALAREVRRRLGYDPFQPPFGQTLEGVVTHTDAGWAVVLYSRGPDGALLGRRALPSDEAECAALADAVALALALAIDPEAALRATEPDPAASSERGPSERGGPADAAPSAATSGAARSEGAASTASTDTTSSDEADRSDGSPPDEPAPAVRVGVGAGGGVDVVPGLAVAARLTIDGPIVPALRWYGAASYWTEQRATRDGASFGVGLVAFSLGLCAGARFGTFRFDGCAALDVGAAYAVVYSPTPRAPGERAYVGATALVRAELEIAAPLWVGVYAGGAVPFVIHQYRVQGRDDVVFQQSPVGPIAGADVALRFP